MTPLRVSSRWVEWAHAPGAESGQALAIELCELITKRDYVLIERADLVREVLDVAELYVVDCDIEWWQTAYANALVKRARAWLAAAEGRS